GDPTTGPQAATKSYVDSVATASGALLRSGGTLTGPLTLSGDPTTTTQAATKRYVDAQVATALPQSGGTVSGALTLSTAPTAAGHAATKQYVDAQVATAVPVSGGTVGGPLNLSATPTAPLHAVPKQYVDGIVGTYGLNLKLAPYGAPLNGSADDTPAFKAAYAAASSNAVIHVPNGTAVLQDCSAWGVSLSKPVKWVLDGTVRADGTALASAVPTGTNPAPTNLPGVVQGHSSSGVEFSRSNSSSTDLAVLHSSYVVGHAGGSNAVIANARTDTLIYNSPSNFVWAGLDRLIWTGIQAPTRTTLVQHVGRYVQTIRQTTTTDSNGAPLPQPELWAACLEYRDVTNKPSSACAASITVEMDWVGNGADDAGNRQIQSLVVAQNDPAGAAVEVANIIGVYLAAGSKGKTGRVFNIGIPFQTAVLDTTAATQLPGAAAIRLAAGHTIAFEPSANNTLAFDSATGTLRWNQGTLSYPVGKGISVGWANVCSANTTLPNWLTGNIVFLIGSSTFTITLPTAASTLMSFLMVAMPGAKCFGPTP
ncbi:MAG: hypothetical protein J0H99_07260, partial [Rhodospirillales bacterium]|nr:hypothetical protein [Rhodospirillales bacterium]